MCHSPLPLTANQQRAVRSVPPTWGTFPSSGYFKPLKRSFMAFSGYTHVFRRPASNCVLTPKGQRALATRKCLEKCPPLKEQLAKWRERAKEYCRRLFARSCSLAGPTGFQARLVLLVVACYMLQPAGANPIQPDRHHAKLEAFLDSNDSLNCSLRTDCGDVLCHSKGGAVQCESNIGSPVEDQLKSFCENQKKGLDTNLQSLNAERHSTSGKFGFILDFELESQSWNVSNVTVRYLCNDEDLKMEKILILPHLICPVENANAVMDEIQSCAKNLWESFQDVLPRFENSNDTPETTVPSSAVPSSAMPSSTAPSSAVPSSTAPSSTAKTTDLPVRIGNGIAIVIAIVIAICYCKRKRLRRTLKEKVKPQFSRVVCRGKPENNPEDDPHKMEAPERVELMNVPV